MLGAYGWAFLRPIRKLYYNITITSIWVIVALFIGGLEVLQVIGSELHTSGAFWDTVQGLSFANLGFYIIGLFMVGWLVSVIVYKIRRIDELDVMSAVRTQGDANSSSMTCADK